LNRVYRAPLTPTPFEPSALAKELLARNEYLAADNVGQPDSIYGEIVVAFVVLRDGLKADPDQLREFAQNDLADYRVPERFVFVSELTKSPTGKVNRSELKQRLLSAAVAT